MRYSVADAYPAGFSSGKRKRCGGRPGKPEKGINRAERAPGWPLRPCELLRRQRRDPLARSADAGGKRARVVARAVTSSPLMPTAPRRVKSRRIIGVAERHQRPRVARFGRPLQEGARGRDVAFGEGDKAFGAQALERRRSESRARRSARVRASARAAPSASLLIASFAIGCAGDGRSASAAGSGRCATNTGCSTAAFAVVADGSMRGKKATTSSPAQIARDEARNDLSRGSGRARPPLLHQAAPAREVVIKPIRILGFRSAAGVGRCFRRRAKGVERGIAGASCARRAILEPPRARGQARSGRRIRRRD